jgi:hypothetical protein
MNQKLSKFSKILFLDYYNFRFHHNHSNMCLYMVKNTRKKDKKGWQCDKILVHLKNLHLNMFRKKKIVYAIFNEVIWSAIILKT